MRGKFKGTILALSALVLLMASTSMWAGTNLGLQLTAASPDPGQATICDNNINCRLPRAPGGGTASDLNPALGADYVHRRCRKLDLERNQRFRTAV